MSDEPGDRVEASPLIYPDGERLAPWRYRSEEEIAALKRAFLACRQSDAEAEASAREGWPDRCPDCQTPALAAHHDGCDWERCPRCSGQIIGCGCLDDGCDD